MAAQEEGGIASLEKDTQFVKKLFYGCPFSGTTLPGHGAGNACYLCLGVGMPTTKSFGREGDELDPYLLAFTDPQLSLFHVLQGVTWFSCGALEERNLEGIDDSDVEGCVASLDPGWEKNVRWAAFTVWEEVAWRMGSQVLQNIN